MSLELRFSFSLSPPPPTPSPQPPFQEPPNKRRKLGESNTENLNNHSNNANNNNVKEESLSNPRRKKRKLPQFCNANARKKSKTRSQTQIKQEKNANKNEHRNVQRIHRKLSTQHRNNTNTNRACNNKPQICDMSEFKWNDIAITSLTTIFEYINIKFLYLTASRVCNYWYNTITAAHSDFIFGFFRKTMHLNPMQPLTLIQLKKYNVSYLKQELKARRVKLNGKKAELAQRLYQSIQNDSLPQNVNHEQCVMNRKRLILFQMKQLYKNELFCQNCHNDWSEYFKSNKKSLRKWEIMRTLTDIHLQLRICRKCLNLKEFQDINMDFAMKYYGLNVKDFVKCGIVLRQGKGQMVNVITSFHDRYTNAYVCERMAKMKYGNVFERRSVNEEKVLAKEARGLLQKGLKDEYMQIYAPDLQYDVDKQRFEFDEILYNATI